MRTDSANVRGGHAERSRPRAAGLRDSGHGDAEARRALKRKLKYGVCIFKGVPPCSLHRDAHGCRALVRLQIFQLGSRRSGRMARNASDSE